LQTIKKYTHHWITANTVLLI